MCSLIPTVIKYREPSVSPAVQQLSSVTKQTNFKCIKNTQKKKTGGDEMCSGVQSDGLRSNAGSEAHNDVMAEGKRRSVQQPRKRLKFENVNYF